ncbi:MAG: 2-polyprenyl-3-methyl-6-methoxy-1,4-benzoquinone monooxygenase [Pseudomonadales bacterium]|nr:2-polyprenyl-3-methyl-6-methoxy-1,4-benzoquinone monooxygenase [Pseudomonadales bacterium]
MSDSAGMLSLDTLISQFDQALKTLLPGSVTPARESPATGVEPGELADPARRHAAGLMRINHSGEVCAQALYQGQSLTAKLPAVRASMDQAAREETDHLGWCETRLDELDSHPSILNPLWYVLSFGLGAGAGLVGDKWSLGFVAETENQVCQHLNEHLDKLPPEDARSRAILEQMLIDEAAHATRALEAGGAELPAPLRSAMTAMAELMKKTVYRF